MPGPEPGLEGMIINLYHPALTGLTAYRERQMQTSYDSRQNTVIVKWRSR